MRKVLKRGYNRYITYGRDSKKGNMPSHPIDNSWTEQYFSFLHQIAKKK